MYILPTVERKKFTNGSLDEHHLDLCYQELDIILPGWPAWTACSRDCEEQRKSRVGLSISTTLNCANRISNISHKIARPGRYVPETVKCSENRKQVSRLAQLHICWRRCWISSHSNHRSGMDVLVTVEYRLNCKQVSRLAPPQTYCRRCWVLPDSNSWLGMYDFLNTESNKNYKQVSQVAPLQTYG